MRLVAFFAKRLGWTLVTLLFATFAAFCLPRLAPGDVTRGLSDGDVSGPSADEASLARFRRDHLLDRPLVVQYLDYLGPFDLGERGHRWFGGTGEHPWGGLLAGDLGSELLRPGVSVAGEIARRLSVTLPLMLAALLLAYAVAIPLGVHAALRVGSARDRALSLGAFVAISLPVFWLGVLLQTALGKRGLDLLPVLWPAGESSTGRVLAAAVLPVVCAAWGIAAYVMRQTRATLVEVLASDWVRTLRARGFSEREIVWRHALRNAAPPLCMHLGQVLPALAAGSVLIETIFDVPGVGTYLVRGLLEREADVVAGVVLASAVFAALGLFLSDVLHAALDPRVEP